MNEHALMAFGFDEGATFSACRRYRYRLWRSWGNREHRVVFVMLNPSTADESTNDPTIRKCIGFAKRWGFGALDVVNLFAWRSTDPRGLLETVDAVGPDNDEAIADAIGAAGLVVLAWGKHPPVSKMIAARLASMWYPLGHRQVGTLGRNSDGSPRHPLMLAYATPFVVEGQP